MTNLLILMFRPLTATYILTPVLLRWKIPLVFVVLIRSRLIYGEIDDLNSDDLDPLFLKALSPRLLPYFTHLFNSENNRTENSPTVPRPAC